MAEGSGEVARRQLARELRKLREEAGMNAIDAAAALGIVPATVSRMENGRTTVSVATARTAADLYGHPELAAAFAELAKASKERSWYRQFSDVIPDWFDAYIGLEQAASYVRCYESEMIPGVLQTEEYIRTIFRSGRPEEPDDEIDRRVQLRLKRQSLLTREIGRPEWHIVLNEPAIMRPIGGRAVMHEQLERLLEVMEMPNITLGVVPMSIGMHAGIHSGPFVLMDFPTTGKNNGEPTTVYAEGFAGALYSVERAEVDYYTTMFRRIQRAALGPDDTKVIITNALKKMEKES